MAIPSAKYAVDYTDGYGFKWSKQIKQIFTTLGSVDMSAALSRFNNPLVQNVYRKSRIFNPIYDNAITYASVGHDSLVLKYFSRSGYPSTDMTSGTVIVNYASPDGQSYATGVNEDASQPYNGGLGDARVLVDATYNKMLFKVTLREMNLGLNPSPVASLYNDPTYTDVDLKDVDPDKWYGLFYHAGAKVWNGSSWDEYSIAPVMICNGDTVQSFQGGGSAFNNLFNNYNGTMGSGQNIEFSNVTSNYYWSGHNFVNRMNIEDYSLGWSGSYDYKPSYADDMDGMKSFMLNYLLDNNYSPWQSQWFQLCRELHPISNDISVLLTCMCYACLDGNNNLYINWNNIYTFPVVKGSSISKFIAGYGLYYLADPAANLTGITPDTLHNCSAVWLGEMSADGTTTGQWIKGADIENYTGYNKNSNIINPDFDPSGGGGGTGTDEDNNDPIPVVAAPYSSGLARYYVTTVASPILGHISEAMGAWNLKDTGKDLYKNIISCKLIKAPAPIPVSASEPFTVYGVKLQYEGADIPLPVISDNPTKSFGSYRIPRKFNDFRDYAPYTKVEIYLPYCGWTVLPSHVVGRSVSVTYYTDIIAATCKAVVYCGSNVIAEAAGVIGLDIPMITENAGAKAEAVTMGLLAYGKAGLQTALGVGAAVATKGKAGVKSAVGGLENLVSAYSQTAMAFNQNYTEINGKNGDGCCIAGISAIVIKITRPKYGANTTAPYVPSEYGHSTGFVSMKSATVGSFTGLLVADNVDTSGISGATDREKQLIKLYLESGVFVRHPN